MAKVLTKVVISDVLVFKALNAPGGIITKDMNKTQKRIILRAQAKAPVNNPLNATHRGGVVGTYRASFKKKRWGNKNQLHRYVYNDAPHAIYVEKGRRSTRFPPGLRPGRWETFGWTQAAGAILDYPGTGARRGRHVLEEAWTWSIRKYVSVGVIRAGGSRFRSL